jgi:hypothetical protein
MLQAARGLCVPEAILTACLQGVAAHGTAPPPAPVPFARQCLGAGVSVVCPTAIHGTAATLRTWPEMS